MKYKQCIDEINDDINKITEEYVTTHYDKASIPGTDKSYLELTVSDKKILDYMLMKIRSRTIAYVTTKKKKTGEKEENLLNKERKK